MQKNEIRKVLTLWGDCDWRDPDDDTAHSSKKVIQGYERLNEEINELAQQVTIHSVSYAHTVMPLFSYKVLRLFVTVLYSAPFNLKYRGTDSVVHEVDLR